LQDGTLVAVSGVGCPAAAAAAVALLGAGATALVSWGLAGGLDPQLPAGTICLPTLILDRDGRRFTTDHRWRERVGAAVDLHRIVAGTLLTSLTAIDHVADKAALFRASGAVAVDMESAGVASVAATHHVPFIAVRVIVDTAHDELPAAVLTASSEGRVKPLRLMRALLQRPRDLSALLRIAKRYRSAKRALVAVAASGTLKPLAFAAAAPSQIV
jgi:adenosylhomocysteine nucleosidase